MRRLCILAIATVCVLSCDPEEYMDGNDSYWYVKNCTQENIYFHCNWVSKQPKLLEPGNSHWIFIRMDNYYEIPPFSALPENIERVWLYDKDSNLVRTWTVSAAGDEGRQLFNEKLWRVSQSKDYGGKFYRRNYTFDILPEDLVPLE